MMKRSKVCVCSVVVAVAVLSVGSAEHAYGQGLHGITIAKGCVSPLCVAETANCDVEIGYNDDFGDTIKILAAWDVQDVGGDDVRIPASGNLPIVAVGGNTTCTVGGALPCLIGPGGSTLSGLPGVPESGFVRFKQNTYVIQADDPDVLRDQATVEWEDLCDDPDTSGCGGGIVNPAPAPASTIITRCDDGNDCTTDTCEAGVCSYTPICETDPDYCDDGNVCTQDTCDPNVDGCCLYEDIVCDPRPCYEVTCDPIEGCVYTPICSIDPDYCDDGNVCTNDICDPNVDGCCLYEDIPCDPRLCYEVTCDPATGCVYTPIICDDGDPCTEDTCDPATGECVYTPIDPPPPDCEDTAGCTPGFWKQRHHLMYWVGYSPDDLYDEVFGVDAPGDMTLLEAAGAGGGQQFALMRHSVAALLNASSDQVNFAYTEAEVIAMVQEAYATGEFESTKNMLEMENQLGCTVDKSRSGKGAKQRGRLR